MHLGFLSCVLCAAALGCTKGRSDDCAVPPPPEPAFRLQLTADRGTLPPGTSIEVTYGGDQRETYELGVPNTVHEDLCCRPGRTSGSGPLPSVPCHVMDASSGLDAAKVDGGAPQETGTVAILCELWTNGTAGVLVTAPGFPDLDRVLDAKLREDLCGVETQDERLILYHAEAGK